MRYPAAIWRPGPLEKQGYPGMAFNACRGVVCHSMVGSLVGALQRLDNVDRDANGELVEYARASWCFSVAKDGLVYQHYETNAVTWHAGTKQANGLYIGIEHEGGAKPNYSEPLTLPQLNASVNLVHWLSQQHSFTLELRKGLWEHNWLSSTACPSNRIPWSKYMEDELTPQQMAELKAHIDGRFLALIKWIQDNLPLKDK